MRAEETERLYTAAEELTTADRSSHLDADQHPAPLIKVESTFDATQDASSHISESMQELPQLLIFPLVSFENEDELTGFH